MQEIDALKLNVLFMIVLQLVQIVLVEIIVEVKNVQQQKVVDGASLGPN